MTDREGRILCTVDADGNFSIPTSAKFSGGEIQSIDTEYLYALTDNDERIIASIDSTGNVVFGEIPSQIAEYIDAHSPDMSGKADITYVDESLALKVDKEEGKCLIDEQTAESFGHEETEYLYALTDNEGKILCAFDGNGAAEMHGTVKTESAEIQSAETEYLYALTDNAGKILAGIDGNGRLVFGEIPETIAEYVHAEISEKVDKEDGKCLVDEQTEHSVSWPDTEYLQAITDADGRMLEYTADDGTKNFPAGIKAGSAKIGDVKAETAEIGGVSAEVREIPEMPECVYALTDNEGRVLQTIGDDGEIKFHAPVSGIPMDGADNSDWSSAESLEIPEPRCAVVNISGISSMPTSKTVNPDDKFAVILLGEGFATMAKIYELRLVIIDTFQMFRKQLSGKGSMYAEDYDTVSRIKSIADKFNSSILILHHLKKGVEGDWLSEISGSQGISGAADTIFSLKRERNSNMGTLHRTGRDVEEKDFIMKLDGFGWQLIGEAEAFYHA